MSSPASISLSEISAGTFTPYIGETFAVAVEPGGAQVATFTLEEASEIATTKTGGRAPFSLIFDGAPDIELEQQTLWLSHPDIGTAGIFVVPISADSQKRRYQAIFN